MSRQCKTCRQDLVEPYIKCMECPSLLCLLCFSLAQEWEEHRAHHSYVFMKNNFSLFEEGWSSEEELALLDAILSCGPGNWEAVGAAMPNKTPKECEEHFFQHYVYHPPAYFPTMPKLEKERLPSPFNRRDPAPPDLSTLPPGHYHPDLAGYMPLRDQFEVEPDNYAEMDLVDMEFDDPLAQEDDPLEEDLKLSVLSVYRNRLRERERRKRIVKRYGLLSPINHFKLWKKLDRSLGRQFTESLRPFTRLLPPKDFSDLLESFNRQRELQERISQLKELRENGVTTLASADLFLQQQKRRTELQQHRQSTNYSEEFTKYLPDKSSFFQWLSKHLDKESSKGLSSIPKYLGRKPAPPLDIKNFADHDKLTEKEKKLCSELRLVPDYYLQQKQLLVLESERLGGLRLTQARSLVKIDVNKTRRIYDLLCEEGVILSRP